MQRVGVVLNALAEVLPMAGPATDIGKAISKAIDALAKVVPPGAVSPAGQKNQLDQMQAKNQQNQGMMKQMQAGAGGGAPGGAPGGGAPPGGMPGMAA